MFFCLLGEALHGGSRRKLQFLVSTSFFPCEERVGMTCIFVMSGYLQMLSMGDGDTSADKRYCTDFDRASVPQKLTMPPASL